MIKCVPSDDLLSTLFETIYYRYERTDLHGLDLIAQSDSLTTEYFAYDGLGSVRQMLDDSADVLLAQTYDPYGSVYASAGVDSTAVCSQVVNSTNFTLSGNIVPCHLL